MAYESQKVDLTKKVTEKTTELLEAIESLKALIAYNTSQQAITSSDAETVIVEGITGGDVLGIITSVSALDTFLTENFHYTNLNKIR